MEISDAEYYNDIPVEYVFYAAKALMKLDERERAEEIKKSFMRYYDANFGKKVTIDYFAVSLPDMLIWEQNLDERNDEFCNFVKNLAEQIA